MAGDGYDERRSGEEGRRTAEYGRGSRFSHGVKEKGFGETALYKLLEQGFNFLGLQNIYGECYLCNPSVDFWYKMVDLYNGFYTILPKRKFWEGIMHDSLYFNFMRGCI